MATYTTQTPRKAGGTPLTYKWTDNPLSADVTKIKKEHMDQLRDVLSGADQHYHPVAAHGGVNSGPELPNVSVAFTDPSLVADETKIRATHLNELITFIKAFEGGTGHRHLFANFDNEGTTNVYSTYYTQALPFEKDPVVADSDMEKASAWQQLRTFLQDLTTHTHQVTCACECTCTCTCTGTCSCTCECTCTCNCATMG